MSINPPLLPSLDIWRGIGEYLPLKNCSALAKTCKGLSWLTTDNVLLKNRAIQWKLTLPQSNDIKDLQKTLSIIKTIQSVIAKTLPLTELLHEIIQHQHTDFLKWVLEDKATPLKTLEIDHPMENTQLLASPEKITEHHALFIYLFREVGHLNNKQCLQVIINSSLFHQIDRHSLGNCLQNAAQAGHTECLQVIIDSSRFKEIASISLELSLRDAVKAGHTACAQTIINSPRFHQIDLQILSNSLWSTAQAGLTACAQVIINSSRFNEIDCTTLGISLWNAAQVGHTAYVQAIINSSRFHEISRSNLRACLRDANKAGHAACVQAFLNSSRVNEIDSDSLQLRLEDAIQAGHTECAQIMINSSRFKDIYTYILEYDLRDTDEICHKACVQTIINSPHFEEMNTIKLAKALFRKNFPYKKELIKRCLGSQNPWVRACFITSLILISIKTLLLSFLARIFPKYFRYFREIDQI